MILATPGEADPSYEALKRNRFHRRRGSPATAHGAPLFF